MESNDVDWTRTDTRCKATQNDLKKIFQVDVFNCKPYKLFVHIKIFKRERQTERVVRLKRFFHDDRDGRTDGRTDGRRSVSRGGSVALRSVGFCTEDEDEDDERMTRTGYGDDGLQKDADAQRVQADDGATVRLTTMDADADADAFEDVVVTTRNAPPRGRTGSESVMKTPTTRGMRIRAGPMSLGKGGGAGGTATRGTVTTRGTMTTATVTRGATTTGGKRRGMSAMTSGTMMDEDGCGGGGAPDTTDTRATKRKRTSFGPLGTMGDLKTTPMQTPASADSSFNFLHRRTRGSSRASMSGGGAGLFHDARHASMKTPGTSGGSKGGASSFHPGSASVSVGTRRRTRHSTFDYQDYEGTTENATTPKAAPEEETPRSTWGDMSPGELGGSQYVMSPEHSSADERDDEDGDDGILGERRATGGKSQTTASAVAAKNERKMFPIFEPGRKTVYLVRHGQSTYNAAISGPGSWEEPQMFDARLTEKGRREAQALGSELSKIPRDALWITSPLTRAIETCTIGCKAGLTAKSERILKKRRMASQKPDGQDDSFDENTDEGNVDNFDVDAAYKDWARKLVIRPDLTEHLYCTGDVGRPRWCLENDFPDLGLAISRLPEDRWWWYDANKPNDAQKQQFNSKEPQNHFKNRVGRFKSWLLQRKETNFVIFGHSTFFKEFSGGRSMKNCEIHTMRL